MRIQRIKQVGDLPARTDNTRELKTNIKFSPKKIKENSAPPNSTLKPETSSDSHSDKSKGVRFLSTKQFRNKIVRIGKKKS